MAMKPRSQNVGVHVEKTIPAVRDMIEEPVRFKEPTSELKETEKRDLKPKSKSDERSSFDNLENQAVNVPHLLKMVTEPLAEFCRESTAPPKLGVSRSQDDDYNEEMEQKFGSVSPIFHPTRNLISAIGASRATNFRSKFRKSHTCGSLYAKCNCSPSPTTLPKPIPMHSSTASSMEYENENENAVATTEASAAAVPNTFHFSVSPPSGESSISSTTTTTQHTSGIYSLSTQTSAATSAQLSHDDSMSASFDFANSGSADIAISTAAGAVGTATASTLDSLLNDDNSLAAAKQSNSTETESRNSPNSQATRNNPNTSNSFNTTCTSPTSATALSPLTTTATATTRKSDRKPKRLFQSYSHPDTDFIFTDENKNPSKESLVQVQAQQEAVIKTRDGKIEIKYPKRSSSPNIGQHQTLDVAVHPDLYVKISPRHSPTLESRRADSPLSSPYSAQQRRRQLQRSHEIESGGSTTDSEHSIDSAAGKLPINLSKPHKKIHQHGALDLNSSSNSSVLKPKSVLPNTTHHKGEDTSFKAAQQYFAESGILGPINKTATNSLIRKTSKILQDSNVIEQIRKTSMILRANINANNAASNIQFNNKDILPTSMATSTTAATTPQTTEIVTTTLQTTTTKTISTTSTQAHYPPLEPLVLKFQQQNNVNMESPTSALTYNPTSHPPPSSQHALATACGFSPNITTQSCSVTDDKDSQIKCLQGEIVSLRDVIKSRDAEIVKLRREIHKLKSVLLQTASHNAITSPDFLQPHAKTCFHSDVHGGHNPSKSCSGDHTSTEGGNISSHSSIDSNNSANYQSCNSSATSTGTTASTCALATDKAFLQNAELGLDGGTAVSTSDALACNGVKPKLLHVAQAPVLKKTGVSGESCETSIQESVNIEIPKYEKDYRSKQLIKEAIMDNDFLKHIDASQVRELVESMYPISETKGSFVITEGEVGAHLYVSAEGEFEVIINGKRLGIMGPGKAFGELAILYNCTRTASIRVISEEARLWVLDRRIFQKIMMRTGLQRIENSVNFLKSVPLLKNLSEELLAKIADVLEVEFYPAGTYIIRQGAKGDTFFLISQGSVKVTQKYSPMVEETEIRTLERGDYFGEQALINEDKRTANIIALDPGVECLTLDRESFTHLIGDLCELKEKSYGDSSPKQELAMKHITDKTKELFGANLKQEFPEMKLTDMEVVATLGVGGFGRVELVKAYRDNRVDIFALKCLKKRHIVDTKQQEHLFNERTIMLYCNSPFICRLYRTFRDNKYVYMLLEACMGGEIWTMLRDRGCFDENATQFIIGCVLQAFEYLHSRGIVYRDLKPENLMLDERGYVKLVDFGFAKHIGHSNKTWTFCGTPEYVAPEIILNRGHDYAVDYWALGVLIHELLNGTPPFTASDPMTTYNIIINGIDMINFPKHMSRSAVQLIKKLCRDVPAERLGYQKGGIQDIKKHKWFLGFDWDGLQSQLLIPPFVRPIAHPTDTCYFDKFPCDPDEPPDELSGWDADF